MIFDYQTFEKNCSNRGLVLLHAVSKNFKFQNYSVNHFDMWDTDRCVKYNENKFPYFYFADHDHGLCYYAVSKFEEDGPVYVDTGSLITMCSINIDVFFKNLIHTPEEILIFSA